MNDTDSLAEHAEAWMKENGIEVPERYSVEWWGEYTKWVEYAFSE